MMETEAWQRGLERAKAELAKIPPPDGTVSVSSANDGHADLYNVPYFKLCKICGWGRKSDKCTCVEDGRVNERRGV
jgi:hypothetical protein